VAVKVVVRVAVVKAVVRVVAVMVAVVRAVVLAVAMEAERAEAERAEAATVVEGRAVVKVVVERVVAAKAAGRGAGLVAVVRVAEEMEEVTVAVVRVGEAWVAERAAAMEAKAVERAATAALGSRRRSPDSGPLPRHYVMYIPGHWRRTSCNQIGGSRDTSRARLDRVAPPAAQVALDVCRTSQGNACSARCPCSCTWYNQGHVQQTNGNHKLDGHSRTTPGRPRR
jgi:hypothetical protein